MIPIAIVEDHPLVRASIIRIINHIDSGIYRIYEYKDGQEFIDRLPTENYMPALVLMDLSMPRVNGYDATAWLKKQYPGIPVLVLTDIHDARAFVLLVRCGANGYVSKQEIVPDGHLNKVMKWMIDGEDYFKDTSLYAFAKKRMAMSAKELKEGLDSLTEPEMKLVRYLSLEKTYNDQAKEQFISHSGYKKRLGKVFKKLKVNSTEALFKCAVEIGFIHK